MIAYCGLDCDKCDAFIATANNDYAMRARVAEVWAREYNVSIRPEDINCAGCKSDGPRVHYCESMCEIRKCAAKKNLSTCATCMDYPCKPLEDTIFGHAPEAKARLDALCKASS
jgi:hypothetical protein